jgi:hypothetical protein
MQKNKYGKRKNNPGFDTYNLKIYQTERGTDIKFAMPSPDKFTQEVHNFTAHINKEDLLRMKNLLQGKDIVSYTDGSLYRLTNNEKRAGVRVAFLHEALGNI